MKSAKQASFLCLNEGPSFRLRMGFVSVTCIAMEAKAAMIGERERWSEVMRPAIRRPQINDTRSIKYNMVQELSA